MEHIQDVKNEETQIVNKRITAPERYLPDGTYNTKPLSPTYFKDYYQKTKADVACEHCLSIFSHKVNYAKHFKRSNRCKRIRAALVEPPPIV